MLTKACGVHIRVFEGVQPVDPILCLSYTPRVRTLLSFIWRKGGPPMRALFFHQRGPGSNPGICCGHMWVEFVVGSLPCSERFFSRNMYSGFLALCLKTNTSKFQFDLERTDTVQ